MKRVWHILRANDAKGFVARLLMWWSPLISLVVLGPVRGWIEEPLGGLYAVVVSAVLGVAGVEHAVDGILLRFPQRGFTFAIEAVCTGYFIFWLYLGAVLAFAASWRARAFAVLAGAVFLFVLNVVRILSLYVVQVFRPEWFEEVHLVFWQSLVVLLTGVFWYGWASRQGPVAASPAPA